MARRGRFARQTGGSNLTQLIYELMRSQFTRQSNAMAAAYYNNSDYRGGGVPTADDVIAFLREYKGSQWLTDYERDQLDIEISKVLKEESTRQNNLLVTKINENPGDVQAVRDYINFLKQAQASANSPFTEDEAKNKLYDANIKLAAALGTALGNDLISKAEFTAQAREIMSAFPEDNANQRNIKEALFKAEFIAESSRWNMKLETAKGKGAGAYAAASRRYIEWLKGVRSRAVEGGLATVNANGDVVNGTETARTIQSTIGVMQANLKSAANQAASEAAVARIDKIRAETGDFLTTVNTVLGSSYGSIEQFLSNQVDVGRFYAIAPVSARVSDTFIDQDRLINMVFTGQNSLSAAAKIAGGSDGSALHQTLTTIQKQYGINTIVDDVGIMFGNFLATVSKTRGDATANMAEVDKMITQLTDLINKYGGSLDPLELNVHRNTLQDLIAARDGKLVNVDDGFSSFDLANPYSSSYEAATGTQQTSFTNVINNIYGDANILKDLEKGFVQSAVMGLDGKWYLGPAVNPNAKTGGMTTMINVNGKYMMVSVAGTPILAPDKQTQQPEEIGHFYDLGAAGFVTVVNGVTYKANFDPFSGTTMTADDFRASYIGVSNTVTAAGQVTQQQDPTFTVPSSDVAPSAERGLGSTTPSETYFKSVQDRIDSIAGVPESQYDRLYQQIISSARQGVVGTEYEAMFDQMFGSTPTAPADGSGALPGTKPTAFSGGPGATWSRRTPGYTPMSQAEFNAFRAGERDLGFTQPSSAAVAPPPSFEGERFLNYSFRNTPIAQSTQTQPIFSQFNRTTPKAL